MGTRRAVSPLLLMLRHQSFQVARLHLPAGHELLDWRELQDGAEKGGQGAMAEEDLIVKN